MSLSNNNKEISFVYPKGGNLFFEKKKQEFLFCKPHLLALKSITLEKLEKMQLEAQKELKEKTAESKEL